MPSCPGCGEQINKVGLAGFVSLPKRTGCGPQYYELCKECAETVRSGNEESREGILMRVELRLLDVEGQA